MSDVDVEEVAFDALREMYEEAEPSADFDEILENADEQDDDWYMDYYLPNERQKEIIKKHCDKHDLNQSERTSVTWTAHLNYGPRGIKSAQQ